MLFYCSSTSRKGIAVDLVLDLLWSVTCEYCRCRITSTHLPTLTLQIINAKMQVEVYD